ncbi:ketoglutarate-dependent dioxygenase FTO [Seminavis robusta]|uniref:Alpha-ketoglutarate-dependent dioxygenase FTO n=1 Tax=Seminavis robusta TaxID=568900 RepID=A0A9N8DG63_9STRA|nr:ketoglutarate-dependent dioxygenase FTO [Seminavis robusta]|eukprot:Sro109_g054700.1 ketoglutarate-dependent dioxygenase FTO (643) ;mRNA; r:102406-104334
MTKKSSNARRRARKKAQQEAAQQPGTSKGKKRQLQEKIHSSSDPHPTSANKKKRKRNQDNLNHHKNKKNVKEDDDDLLAFAQAWASNTNNNNNNQRNEKEKNPVVNDVDRPLPPFPSRLPVPTDGFLRDEDPYRESFQAAVDTVHQGLVWETSLTSTTTSLSEDQIQRALVTMDDAKLFRTDVTQPAGLGAKLVPSYVTRCLLGDEGTTYRYLGLRMFAHPWNGKHTSTDQKLQSAVTTFGSLNQHLSRQTKKHLTAFHEKRGIDQSSKQDNNKKACFTVTLINKMTPHKRLREEPMFQNNKYSVGWHADSSLEHFSTIAVYHTILAAEATTKHSSKKQDDDEWAVALRVTRHAEGPKAKRLGDITVDDTGPPIAVALPSGSTYYMLHDYNHHHQHAVLAPPTHTNKSTRYSSTHRLLRPGHTVQEMIAKCQHTNMQHHGPKKWRSEQLLLNELENEWLRQFFIQGPEHQQLLWGYWKTPLTQLFDYWERLEARTLQVVTLLGNAAVARCHNDNDNNKKQYQEALAIVMQVQGDRKKKNNALETIYEPFAKLLLERAKSRELWAKREKDPVFAKMPKECRPIPFPVAYGKENKKDHDSMAHSSLPDGSPTFLTQLAVQVQAWGRAFDSRNAKHLPNDNVLHC